MPTLDGSAAYHGQVQCGGWISDPVTIFPGGDIEQEMESFFDAPMKLVGGHHVRKTGAKLSVRNSLIMRLKVEHVVRFCGTQGTVKYVGWVKDGIRLGS
jgi:hypothetical protein